MSYPSWLCKGGLTVIIASTNMDLKILKFESQLTIIGGEQKIKSNRGENSIVSQDSKINAISSGQANDLLINIFNQPRSLIG